MTVADTQAAALVAVAISNQVEPLAPAFLRRAISERVVRKGMLYQAGSGMAKVCSLARQRAMADSRCKRTIQGVELYGFLR